MRKIILMSLLCVASLMILIACASSIPINEDSRYFVVDVIETQDMSYPPSNDSDSTAGQIQPLSLTSTAAPFELQFGNHRGTGNLQLIDVNIIGDIPAGYHIVVMHSPPGHHLPWFMNHAHAINTVLFCDAVARLDAYFVRDIMAFLMGTEDPIAQATWERPGPPPPELQFGNLVIMGYFQSINLNIAGTLPSGYSLIVMHTPQGVRAPQFTGPASATNTIQFCQAVVRLDAYLVRNTQAFLAGTEDAIAHASWQR